MTLYLESKDFGLNTIIHSADLRYLILLPGFNNLKVELGLIVE